MAATADTLDHFLPAVLSQDTKRRLEAGEELICYLRNKQTSLYCEEMDKLADGLASWVNCSNFKVRLGFCRRQSAPCFSHSVSLYIHSLSSHTLRFNGHFPGEPGLDGCPLNCPSPFIPGLHILLDFRRPLCLIPSASHVIQRLTQSLSSFRSTCPNHLNYNFDHQTDWFQC